MFVVVAAVVVVVWCWLVGWHFRFFVLFGLIVSLSLSLFLSLCISLSLYLSLSRSFYHIRTKWFEFFFKIKRASRSLLRQVPKVSIPFETGIEIEEIRSPFSGSSPGPPFGTLLGSLFGSFLGSIWEPLGALWTPLVPLGISFEAFGSPQGLLHHL